MSGRTYLDPGALDARLTLESFDGPPDGQGGVSEAWSVMAELWGRVEPLKATPGEAASALTAPVSHRVTIRYRDDVHHAMRFQFRGRVLAIMGVRDPDERRRYLVCDCQEERP